MKARPLAGLFCFLLLGTDPLSADSNPPMGRLGLPLGTFAVIEGMEHHTGKFWGADDFVVESINGKKPVVEIRLQTDWSPQLTDKRVSGKRYVLHGYESGKWEGQPDGLPQDEPYGRTQSGRFLFQHCFVVTSVEKMDGVSVSDARPLDPKVSLAEPNFAAATTDSRPIGVLGVPLGTFAIIEAHSQIVMLESPFAVDSINGKYFDHSPILTIRGVPETKGNGRVTLRGYETGEWGSEPDLPKSESPDSGRVQQFFQFYHRFVVTSTPRLKGN